MSNFYCKLCDVNLADESHLQVHLGSSKHKGMASRTDGALSYQALSARHPGVVGDAKQQQEQQQQEKQKPQKQQERGVSSILECQLCGVKCLSLSTYQTHMNGVKHAKRLKEVEFNQKAKAKDPDVYCDVCDVTLHPKLMETHRTGKKHLVKLREAASAEVPQASEKAAAAPAPSSEPADRNGDAPSAGAQQLLSKFNKEQLHQLLGKRYHMQCSVCGDQFSSFSQAEHHFNSKAHRTAYLERQKKLCLAKGKRCDVCNVIVGSAELYDAHVRGYKHTLRAGGGHIPPGSQHYDKFVKHQETLRAKRSS